MSHTSTSLRNKPVARYKCKCLITEAVLGAAEHGCAFAQMAASLLTGAVLCGVRGGSLWLCAPVLQLLYPQPCLVLCTQQVVLHQTNATPHTVEIHLHRNTAHHSTAPVCRVLTCTSDRTGSLLLPSLPHTAMPYAHTGMPYYAIALDNTNSTICIVQVQRVVCGPPRTLHPDVS